MLNVVAYIIGCFPLFVRRILGRSLGSLFALLPTKERTIAALQLDLILKQKGGRTLLNRMYMGLGQTLLEFFNLKPILKRAPEYLKIEGADSLERALNRGQGLVVLSAHIGNWELLAAFIAERTQALSVVGREANYAGFQQVLSRIRRSNGIKTIWRANPGSARQIIKDLRANRVIGVLVDQDTDVESMVVPFFGRAAKCPSTIIEIAKRNGAQIVIGFAFRENARCYKINIHEVPHSLSNEQILLLYNQRLESYILQYPEQWVWFHKRWRTQEDTGRMSSKLYIEYLQRELSNAA